MTKIDIDKLRESLMSYYDLASANGFALAMDEVFEVDSLNDDELIARAEQVGLDPNSFAVE